MTNASLQLSKKIPEQLVEVLRLMSEAADKLGARVFVIGATARDLILEYGFEVLVTRATSDVDFGIAVESWEAYRQLTCLLKTNGFEIDPSRIQRLRRLEMTIDLVPFGGLEYKPGEIAWPPDGDVVMKTVGFEEAFGSSLIIDLGNGDRIRVASMAGVVLLKIVAFNDRPEERHRDAQDFFVSGENYVDLGNDERLYGGRDSDLLDDENFDRRVCGFRLLGRDVGEILTEESFLIVDKVLSGKETGGRLERFATAVSYSGLCVYDVIVDKIAEFRKGILERFLPRDQRQNLD